MRRPRTETIKFLTQDETHRLFSVIKDKRDKARFLVAYRHGLRSFSKSRYFKDYPTIKKPLQGLNPAS